MKEENIFGNHPFPPDKKKALHIKGDLIKKLLF